ncbi:hypothetical protein EWM64_g6714, partial [Hericium alpestre]
MLMTLQLPNVYTSGRFRNAYDMKRALAAVAEHVKPIGSCPVERNRHVKRIKDDCDIEFDSEEEYEDEDKEDKECRSANARAMDELGAVYHHHSRSWSGGQLGPFKLKISLPGFEFDGLVEDVQVEGYPHAETREKLPQNVRVREMFEHAETSGFGDIRAQETKVDSEVRNAREIPASQFTVESELLASIADCWTKDFLPSAVRVEPYKIHLYGPGGHFKTHRDT